MPINIETVDDLIVVKLSGPSRVFGLKGRLDVPKSHITSVEVMARRDVPPTPGTWLRAPGTFVPGLVHYGSYGREPNREFWAVYRQPEVLVLTVRDWAYSRLVLATKDPRSDAATIGAAA
jgi:hypothetical protein